MDTQPITTFLTQYVPDLQALYQFGSQVRGDARPGSDIDLAVIAPEDWDGRADLQEQVHARLGNNCDALHLTPDEFTRAPEDREPVIAEILRDGVTLDAGLLGGWSDSSPRFGLQVGTSIDLRP